MTGLVFPDARLITRDVLRTLLADRPEPEAQGVTVSTKPSDPQGARPYVRVQVDGSSRTPRLNGQQAVRLSIWHRDEGLGFALARLCEALLLGAHAPGVRSFGDRTGPLPTEDPDTGEPLSYLTLTARLVPEQLD